MKSTRIASLPRLIVEEGSFLTLPDIIAAEGIERIGIVHGHSVYTKWGEPFLKALAEKNITCIEAAVSGEPSPEVVDVITRKFRPFNAQLIVAVGGGSVLDAGKAAAAMLAEVRMPG